MTRTTRRILFYCAIAIFLAVSYVVLVYAQGYKYSFSEGKFVRSGALYVKANTSANIFINGKLKTDTSLLGNSASVGSLSPGGYTLSVQKEGWSAWQKKVVIKAGFVEDFSHIMLLPQVGQDKENIKQEIYDLLYPKIASPSFTPTLTPTPTPTSKKTPKPSPTPIPTPTSSPTPIPYIEGRYYIKDESLYVRVENEAVKIASNVKMAVLSKDNQKLAWLSDGQVWLYWFSDTDYQPVHYAGDVALITHFTYPVKTISWFRDNDHLAIDASGLKVVEIDTRPGLNIINF